MKNVKLYIPVIKSGKKVTLLSANKIKELEPFLPSKEALVTHMEIQRISVLKDKDYEPKPLEISIKSDIFNQIIKKNSGIRNPIALVVQWPAIPICLIYPKEDL